MKAIEVRKMNDEELGQERDRLRRQLFQVRAQAVTEKLENPKQLGQLRRDIARIQTEQTARELRKNPKTRKGGKTRRERKQEQQKA